MSKKLKLGNSTKNNKNTSRDVSDEVSLDENISGEESLKTNIYHEAYGFEVYDNSNAEIRTERNEESYSDYHDKPIEYIFRKPHINLGDISVGDHKEYIYLDDKIVLKTLKYSPGIVRIFLEILTNAADNADESRRLGIDPGKIYVTVVDDVVTIRSEGEAIPLSIKEGFADDEPFTFLDYIFSIVTASSNHNPNIIRMGCGVNGIGAKLANIFSRWFRARAGNKKQGIEQESIWSHNMQKCVSRTITPSYVRTSEGNWILNKKEKKYVGPNYVEISYKIDPRQFCDSNKMLQDFYQNGYSQEIIGLFQRLCFDISLTCKVPIVFNDIEYDYRKIEDYATLFFSEDVIASSFIHYEWGMNPIPSEKGKKLQKLIDTASSDEHIPDLQILILDTPDNSIKLSFVNGMMTPEGGVHLEEVYKNFSNVVLPLVNPNKEKKKDDDDEKTKKGPKLTLKDIKDHVSVIINYRVRNPQFVGQAKTKLSAPKPKVAFVDKEGKELDTSGKDFTIKKIKSWNLFQRLYAALDAKNMKTAKKFDGKRTKHIFSLKGSQANYAGTSQSLNCVLFGAEGDSACGYLKDYIAFMEFSQGCGRDFCGYLPFRGKLINAAKIDDILKIIENKEVQELMKYMGLSIGMDVSTQAGLGRLRYGRFISCADADEDGKHINLLLINLFNRLWPSFLKEGRFCILITPAVRVYNKRTGKEMFRFYSNDEYEHWSKKNYDVKKHEIKYFKGLGTNEKEDIIEDLKHQCVIFCVYDELAQNSLSKAFDRKKEDERKKWIEEFREKTQFNTDVIFISEEDYRCKNISDLINYDLVDFAVSTLQRAMPHKYDGLKKSQRQALYYMLDHCKYGEKCNLKKIAELAGEASALVKYHHGSLSGTIINMAQCYIGRNNLNVIRGSGQIGSRRGSEKGAGKDAAADRYVSATLAFWSKYAIRKELVELVPKHIVEGEEVEPFWIPSDIPLHFINGSKGVAFGHSNEIPQFNPLNIIDYLLKFLENLEIPEDITLKPWYYNFRGEIELIQKAFKTQEDDLFKEDDDENVSDIIDDEHKETYGGGITMKTSGIMEILECRETEQFDEYGNMIKEWDLLITELPIRIGIEKYRKDFLDKCLMEEKCSDIEDKAGKDEDDIWPKFLVTGWKSTYEPTLRDLKLVRCFGISNITLIDNEIKPIKCPSLEDALFHYCEGMLDIYSKYIISEIQKIADEINKLINKKKLIKLVNEGKINIKDDEDIIYSICDENNIPRDIYDKIGLNAFNKKKMESIDQSIDKKIKEKEDMEKNTPQQLWSNNLKILRKKIVNGGINGSGKRKYPEN